MRSNCLIQFSVVSVLAASLAACQSTPTEPEPTPRPKLTAPNNGPPGAHAHDHGHEEQPTSAPFVVKLTKPEKAPNPGELVLVATIFVPREFKAPTTIDVELPKGAELLEGKAHESFASLSPGTMVRTYRMKIDKDPTQAAPVKVRVAGASPGGAFGAAATRRYPELVARAVNPYSGRVPPPPVARPAKGIPARFRPVGVPVLPTSPDKSGSTPK